jgi:hypothetical protein
MRPTQSIILGCTIAVAGCGALASFDSLTGLAGSAGIHPAWTLAAATDGAAAVASLAALVKRSARGFEKSYPGTVAVLMVVVSATANAIHAQATPLSSPERIGLSTIAPISAALAVHLAITLGGQAQKSARRVPATVAAKATLASSKAAAPARSGPAGVKPNASKDRTALLARIRDHAESTGAWPSGPMVASEWLGGSVSRKTGSRLVAAARSAAGE